MNDSSSLYAYGQTAHDRHASRRWPLLLTLALLLCLAHGAFDLTFDKRAGIIYLREVLIVASSLGAFYILLRHPALLRLKICFYIVLYIVAFIALSALFSYLWFKQPLFYSLLEERRVLGVAWFFIFLAMVVRRDISIDQVVNAYLIAGLILSLYSFLLFFSIIPDNAVADVFIEQHYYAVDDPRNATRYVLAPSLLLTVIPLALLTLINPRSGTPKALALLVLIACICTLLLVNQTRVLTANVALVTLAAFLHQSGRRHWPVALGGAALLVLFAGFMLVNSGNEKITWMIRSMLDGQTVRLNTASIILSTLQDSWYWGHGALSVQFNRGFLDIYNENFWLNDVGKLGLLYRFGFLSIVFLAFYIYIAIYLWRIAALYDHPYPKIVFWIYLSLLLNPMGNITEIAAVDVGILTGWLIHHENRAHS